MKDILEMYSSKIKKVCSTNQDMQTYVDSCNKEPEKCAAYTEKSILHYENVADIINDGDSVIP